MTEPRGPHDPDGVVIAAMLDACPSFRDQWRTHQADWADAPEAQGPYTDVGLFATHLVNLLQAGAVAEFPTVFDAIEELVGSADPGVRYLVTNGLLEDLGTVAANRRDWTFAGQFRGWLGPESRVAWDALHRVWGTSDPRGPVG